MSAQEFDEEMLTELREDMGEAFTTFVSQFQSRARQTLDAIEACLSSAQYKQAEEHAHSLRGTAGYLGAVGLQTHLAALQQAAAASDAQQAQSHMSLARQAYSRFEAWLAARV